MLDWVVDTRRLVMEESLGWLDVEDEEWGAEYGVLEQ
jgi:hypothetical protein